MWVDNDDDDAGRENANGGSWCCRFTSPTCSSLPFPAEAHAVSAGKDELWRSLFADALASIAAAAPVEVFHAAA